MAEPMVSIKVQLPRAAREVWDKFLVENGITMGAFLQAVAEDYVEGQIGIGGRKVLNRAREITAERRRRS
jgi:hypothetical protein